jgi:N-acetylglucosaminyldiphosphoundecaprenol N-acetyl-beta-D-mannosaminyltransferase
MTSETAGDIPPPVWVWGVPLAPLTFAETLDHVERLIREGTPRYFITANLHYAMLTAREPRLDAVNRGAAFVLADGMPLVWASRWRPRRLPERVTGSDLVPALCDLAARKGYRVFFLGGAPEVAAELGPRLQERFPGLQVAGIEAPPFRPLTAAEQAALFDRIRAARPDLLFVAFGQPKGEIWIAEHHKSLGVPASVQVGATVDFLAGRVPRAPRLVQRVGMEWAYRLYREPGRLARRYWDNGLFALRMLIRDAASYRRRGGDSFSRETPASAREERSPESRG